MQLQLEILKRPYQHSRMWWIFFILAEDYVSEILIDFKILLINPIEGLLLLQSYISSSFKRLRQMIYNSD